MNQWFVDNFLNIKITLGVAATLGLYSVLYRETKFYRFFEHIFIGLSVGWAIVAIWTETLKSNWWDRMVGQPATDASIGTYGYWAYAILLPIGLMGYFVFSKKHNWMSRIPIGIMLGLWSGQQVEIFWRRNAPQIAGSIRPIWPTTFDSFTVPPRAELSPEQVAALSNQVYPSQALNNLIFVFTLVSVLTYFLFSFRMESKLIQSVTKGGRWLMMVGFGAIFGSTVMTRFVLLIDRMFFIWIEWLRDGVLRSFGINLG